MNEVVKKRCCHCKDSLNLEDFSSCKSNLDGLSKWCRKCNKEYYNKRRDSILKSKKEYYKENRDKKSEYNRDYYEKNRKKILKNAERYHKENKEKRNANTRKYHRENKEKIKENKKKYIRNKRKTDSIFKLNSNFSCLIYQSLRQNKNGKHWEDIVGYTVDDLKNHLESLWEPWMNWENYGIYKPDGPKVWQIDHIIPKSWFNYTSYKDEEFKRCWELSNLQPKEGKANILKSNNHIG